MKKYLIFLAIITAFNIMLQAGVDPDEDEWETTDLQTLIQQRNNNIRTAIINAKNAANNAQSMYQGYLKIAQDYSSAIELKCSSSNPSNDPKIIPESKFLYAARRKWCALFWK